MKYRKKPVVIEAHQFLPDLCGSVFRMETTRTVLQLPIIVDPKGKHLVIETLEGNHRADPCDWIIEGVKGEFYPCKPDIFSATYEEVA